MKLLWVLVQLLISLQGIVAFFVPTAFSGIVGKVDAKIDGVEVHGSAQPSSSSMADDEAKVWRVDDRAVDYLGDARWKLSENHLKCAEQLLEAHKIETVSQLKAKIIGSQRDKTFQIALCNLFSSLLWGDLNVHLAGSLQESLRPEKILDKKTLNENGYHLTERVSQVQEYTNDAIAVRYPDSKDRQFDIRIVNGPSGSGKTVFAINNLALVEDGAGNDKKAFVGDKKMAVCVYYSLSEHSPSSYTPDTFILRVREVLQKALQQASRGKWQWDPENTLNMRVSLILDEAGTLASILGTREVLTGIYDEIGACAKFPRLILAGTGYDETPKGISSATDVYKYRMKPWTEKNLGLVARMRYPENDDGEHFVKEIGKHPLLTRLITNARAAVFTLDAVKQLKTGHPIVKLQGSIGTIIQMVIGRYTALNGIAKLTDKQRKALAYAVFHELNLNNISAAPRFPEFNTISTLDEGEQGMVKRQAQGVVDLHVETSSGVDGGKPKTSFVDEGSRLQRRSVSITPAMSLLLYNLLGVDATLYDNWEGLEVTAALHAAYVEVLNNKETQELGVEIARLTKAVPAPAAKKNIYIPSKVTTPTIYINGDKAPFFDAIAKFRGLQVKHSATGETIDLDLGKEMEKCGLLKERLTEDAKAFKMGNAALAAFLHTWNHDTKAPPSNDGDAKENEGVPPRFFSPAFCFPTSGSADKRVVPTLHFTMDEEGSVMLDDRMVERVKFSKTKPFEMVIVTNARQMRLLPTRNGKAIAIDADSVGANGELISAPDGYDEYLKALKPRENVHIRFVFTGHEN